MENIHPTKCIHFGDLVNKKTGMPFDGVVLIKFFLMKMSSVEFYRIPQNVMNH